jgi:hypothetical protein
MVYTSSHLKSPQNAFPQNQKKVHLAIENGQGALLINLIWDYTPISFFICSSSSSTEADP